MSYGKRLVQSGRENVRRRLWEQSACKHLELQLIGNGTRQCQSCRAFMNKNVADVIQELNGIKGTTLRA